jgi:DNA-binding transcriptional regulator/RsmH inhibitor MraZ
LEIRRISFVFGKGSTFEIWEPKSFAVYLENAKAEAKLKRNMLRLNK